MNKELLIHIQSPPKEASREQLISYFSRFGKVVSLKFFTGDYFNHMQANQSQNHAQKIQIAKSLLQGSTSTPNSALLECSGPKMKEAILNQVHFYEGKAIRVRSYMDEEELIEHIETVRETRMFVNGIPAKFTNDTLFEFFSKFGEVKSAYITREPAKGEQRLGYVIFKEKGVIERFDPAGIVIDSNYTLGWSSYYHKNEKKHTYGKSKIHDKKNAQSVAHHIRNQEENLQKLTPIAK